MALKLLSKNLSHILWNWNQVCLQSQTNILVVNVTEKGCRNRGGIGGANQPLPDFGKTSFFKTSWITTCLTPTRFADLPTALRRLGAALNWLFPARLTYTSATTLPTLTFPRSIFWPLKRYGAVHKCRRLKICNFSPPPSPYYLFMKWGFSSRSYIQVPPPSPLRQRSLWTPQL